MADKATIPVSNTNIDSILQEQRKFEPPEEFRQTSHIKSEEDYERLYRESIEQPEKFWGRIASELHWFKKWDKVLEWKNPWAKWFVGGQFNLSYNCLDRHLQTSRKNKAAIIWESEPGEVRTLTYQQLHREVQKFANVMKSLGVKKGDRVAIYMGMTPELPIAMLACARIGAPHTIIFGGFSSHALIDRIHDSQATLVITQDGSFRRGTEVKLFPAVEEALKSCPSVKNAIVYKRTGTPINMQSGRDLWWHELMANASDECPAETPSIRFTSFTPRAQQESLKAWCTPPAAIPLGLTSPPNGSSTFTKKTLIGVPPTLDGSPATATSFTARYKTVRQL